MGVKINRSIKQGGTDPVYPLSSVPAQLVSKKACMVVR